MSFAICVNTMDTVPVRLVCASNSQHFQLIYMQQTLCWCNTEKYVNIIKKLSSKSSLSGFVPFGQILTHTNTPTLASNKAFGAMVVHAFAVYTWDLSCRSFSMSLLARGAPLSCSNRE